MAVAEIREIIPAPTDAVFELIHDYPRRLEWDTLLQEAYLEAEFREARLGAISVCRGRWYLGGFAVRTKYVSFEKRKVAAVKMLNQPPFFESFAASIRHSYIDDHNSGSDLQTQLHRQTKLAAGDSGSFDAYRPRLGNA